MFLMYKQLTKYIYTGILYKNQIIYGLYQWPAIALFLNSTFFYAYIHSWKNCRPLSHRQGNSKQ